MELEIDMNQLLEVTDILNLFESTVVLSELIFADLILRRPKLIIRTLKQFTGTSITGVSVAHVFGNKIHNLEFRVKLNLLMKLIQSMSGFNGTLSEAKELTDLLIRFGCDFRLDFSQKSDFKPFSKLFYHNIAQNLCSIDDRIEWQFTYIWFLAKKPEFQDLLFQELHDYWTGEAMCRLKRIMPSMDTTADKCRKFAIILLISAKYPDIETKLTPKSLELLDSHSLKLLLYIGFDFTDCLKTYYKLSEEIDERDDELVSKNPKLMQFLTDVEYYQRPLKLKDQIRIYFRRQKGSNLNSYAKQLSSDGFIPESVSDFLRYRHFVQF